MSVASLPARLASGRRGSEVGARASTTGIKELNLRVNEGAGAGGGFLMPACSQGLKADLQGRLELRGPLAVHQPQRHASRPLPLQQQRQQQNQAQGQQQQSQHKRALAPSLQLLASPRPMVEASHAAEQGSLEEEVYASVEAFNVIHAQAMAVKRSNRFV